MPHRILTAATALALAAAAPLAMGFTLDGKLSAGDAYSVDISVPFVTDTAGAYSGHLLVGRDGNAGDIYLLLEVPTSLKDLTYGANSAPGWPAGKSTWSNVQGSERWAFNLAYNGGSGTAELDLKTQSGNTVGHVLTSNANGVVLDGRTSLDWNMSQFDYNTPSNNPGGVNLTSTSPGCGSTLGSPTSDADCYAHPQAGYSNYEFAQLYELQLDGSKYTAGLDLATFGANISSAYIHASPNKVLANNVVTLACDGTSWDKNGTKGGSLTTCMTNGGGNQGVGVPEPPAVLLLGAGLVGLAASRRRRG